nr:unnamed protein product [Callosobruchus chinensis]
METQTSNWDTGGISENISSQIVSTDTQSQPEVSLHKKDRPLILYKQTDTGPFHVYAENINNDFANKLNPVKVGEAILKALPDIDNQIKKIEPIGNNRVRIIFRNSTAANALLKASNFFKIYNLDFYIPKFMVHRQGIIAVDKEFSEEYMLSKVKPYDLHCNFTVEPVKRMHRRVTENNTPKFVPINKVIIGFEAQELPKYISINHVIFEVSTYIQKVILCHNCMHIGHLGKQCKGKPRCAKCKEEHPSNACPNPENETKCFYCEGNHYIYKIGQCSEFQRKKDIKKYMATSNYSYKDAEKAISQISYDQITKYVTPRRPSKRNSPLTLDSTEQQKREIINQTSLPVTRGGILNSPHYEITETPSHQIQINPNDENYLKNVLELVLFVLSNLKETSNQNLQKTQILELIKERVSIEKECF